MANGKLRGQLFKVPDKVLTPLAVNLKKFSDRTENKGFNRAIFILEKRACTYEQLKRIKNYFDSITEDNIDEVEYALNGGELMQKWVNYVLDQARRSVKGSKTARSNAGMENQFRKDAKDTHMPSNAPEVRVAPSFMGTEQLMEELVKIKSISEKLN